MTTATAQPPADRRVKMLADADPTASAETVAAAAERCGESGRRICAGAADLIRRHGCAKGRLGDYDSGFCQVGALRPADRGDRRGRTRATPTATADPDFGAACTPVRQRPDDTAGRDSAAVRPTLPDRSDHPDRTEAEVLEVPDDLAGEGSRPDERPPPPLLGRPATGSGPRGAAPGHRHPATGSGPTAEPATDLGPVDLAGDTTSSELTGCEGGSGKGPPPGPAQSLFRPWGGRATAGCNASRSLVPSGLFRFFWG